jgi:hypothetical protein
MPGLLEGPDGLGGVFGGSSSRDPLLDFMRSDLVRSGDWVGSSDPNDWEDPSVCDNPDADCDTYYGELTPRNEGNNDSALTDTNGDNSLTPTQASEAPIPTTVSQTNNANSSANTMLIPPPITLTEMCGDAVFKGITATIIFSAADIQNYLRGQISLERLCRRVGPTGLENISASLTAALVARVTNGLPSYVKIPATLMTGFLTHNLAKPVGRALINYAFPPPPPQPDNRFNPPQ